MEHTNTCIVQLCVGMVYICMCMWASVHVVTVCQGVHATVPSKKLVEFLSLHTRKGLHLCFSPAHLAGVACTGSLGLVCPQLVQGGKEESE